MARCSEIHGSSLQLAKGNCKKRPNGIEKKIQRSRSDEPISYPRHNYSQPLTSAVSLAAPPPTAVDLNWPSYWTLVGHNGKSGGHNKTTCPRNTVVTRRSSRGVSTGPVTQLLKLPLTVCRLLSVQVKVAIVTTGILKDSPCTLWAVLQLLTIGTPTLTRTTRGARSPHKPIVLPLL